VEAKASFFSIGARWLAALALSGAIVGPLQLPTRAAAQAANAEDVAEGMRLYRQKGDCQACHGWAADGRKMDTQMPDGANLRTTRLNRANLGTLAQDSAQQHQIFRIGRAWRLCICAGRCRR